MRDQTAHCFKADEGDFEALLWLKHICPLHPPPVFLPHNESDAFWKKVFLVGLICVIQTKLLFVLQNMWCVHLVPQNGTRSILVCDVSFLVDTFQIWRNTGDASLFLMVVSVLIGSSVGEDLWSSIPSLSQVGSGAGQRSVANYTANYDKCAFYERRYFMGLVADRCKPPRLRLRICHWIPLRLRDGEMYGGK